jgi:PAS domain S-box-containing protein
MARYTRSRPWLAFGLAILFVVAAIGPQIAAGGMFHAVPYMMLFSAVALAALFGGLYAGILATVLAAVGVRVFMFQPFGSFAAPNPVEAASTWMFVIVAFILVLVAHALIKAADVNERLLDRLREQLADLGELYRNATIGIWEYDRELRYVRVNQALANIHGLPIEAHIGKRPNEILPIWPFEALLRQVIETGQPVHGRETRAGRWLPPDQQRDWVVSYYPLHDAAGGVRGVGAIGYDITETKRAALAAQESEQRFRLMAEGAPVIIFVNGLDGCEYANSAYLRFFGVQIDQLKGFGWADFTHPNDREALVNGYKAAVARAAPFNSEARFLRADGQYRWLRIDAAPRTDHIGRLVGYTGICVDVTEGKLFENSQRVLIAELDHRVRNTLAVVQSLARISLNDTEDDVFFGRLQALANAHGLLADAKWRGVSLADLLALELKPFRTPAATRMTMEGPAVMLSAEKTQALALVFHELASNASRHGALSTVSGRLGVRWRVADDGKDLVLEWAESDGPAVQPPGSEGFGSRLIRRTLSYELQGEVQNEFRPQGFQCTLRIPLGSGVEADPAEPVPVPVGSRPSQAAQQLAARTADMRNAAAGKKVLVVEDNGLVAMMLAEVLASAGYTVLGPAQDLASACDMAQRETPDFGVLDVNLNGERVFPVAEILTQRGIPFVFMSGYGESAEWPDQFRATTRIAKPLSDGELLDALRSFIERPKEGAG